MRKRLLVALFLGAGLSVFAQEIELRRTTDRIEIDGVLEGTWMQADSAYDFVQYFPMDTSLAYAPTVARILYDEQFLYVSGYMHNPDGPREYVTTSLRRDFTGAANDSFSILIDAFKDNTNAFIFGVNPFGVMREGLISDGGSGFQSFSLDWDNKWFAEARQYDDHWIVEMAIPFKTLRFGENQGPVEH